MKKINQLRDRDSEGPRERTRQSTQNFDERPRSRVFEFSPHQESVTLSSEKSVVKIEPCGDSIETCGDSRPRLSGRAKLDSAVPSAEDNSISRLPGPTSPACSKTDSPVPEARLPRSAPPSWSPCARRIRACCLYPASRRLR